MPCPSFDLVIRRELRPNWRVELGTPHRVVIQREAAADTRY